MTTVLIVTLFLVQLITIFAIVILNSKLSKFHDLEKRQNELVNEMDNAISVYLMEMREENDRLINELKKQPVLQRSVHLNTDKQSSTQYSADEQMVKSQNQAATVTNKINQVSEPEPRKFIPVKQAAHAYKKQKNQQFDEVEESVETELFKDAEHVPSKPLTTEQQAVELYRNGKSIEEIAKIMQRGKTEIELLVKFHA
ncbi:DUF6115 domain-containing protein [Solibacillus merdavium]|uniref:Coupling factor for flagellin transcription and translation n=1 Tax=Solibacillus merdavium TaxID=2762218 RepID=A0ABR8XIM0_9BACL|nr:hypothetical protein [Solibacillus merdavium]MBD8031779.1 hypothetical protein [Solibacillus merdavium]